jgi:2-polyprenyl-6-methoxyphenol hydroxylase-like FAD-dependent oxidoreductase
MMAGMATDSRRSIFIAGAGPVGLTAAIELKRRGHKVRIVDPDKDVSPESRALAVNQRTLDLMAPSGAADSLLAAGHRVKKVVVRKNGRVLARLDLTQIPHRYNFLLVLAQSRTEEILAEHARALGVKVERGVALAGFEDSEQVTCTLSRGTACRGDLLFGADGAHSPVRRALGLAFDGETEAEEFGLADVELADWPFPFDTAVLTVMPHHLAPFIPMREGAGRFITTRSNCLNSLPADARIRSAGWNTDFRISYRQVSSYQKGHVFLAGDAAHIHSPVGGRGMNLGMEDACWFAHLVSQGREAEYTALRHPVGKHVLGFTRGFTSLARSGGVKRAALLRGLLPFITTVPFLRQRMYNALTALDTPPPEWL